MKIFVANMESANVSVPEKRHLQEVTDVEEVSNKKPNQANQADAKLVITQAMVIHDSNSDSESNSGNDDGNGDGNGDNNGDNNGDDDDLDDGFEKPPPHTTVLPLPDFKKAVDDLRIENQFNPSRQLARKLILYTSILRIRKHLGEEAWKQWLEWYNDEEGPSLPCHIAHAFDRIYTDFRPWTMEDEEGVEKVREAWDGWKAWIWGKKAEEDLPRGIWHAFRSVYAKRPTDEDDDE